MRKQDKQAVRSKLVRDTHPWPLMSSCLQAPARLPWIMDYKLQNVISLFLSKLLLVMAFTTAIENKLRQRNSLLLDYSI